MGKLENRPVSVDCDDGTPDVTEMDYDRAGSLAQLRDAAGLRPFACEEPGRSGAEETDGAQSGTATTPGNVRLDYDYDDTYGTLHVMTTYRDLVAATKSRTTWVRDPGTGRLLHKLDARFDPYGQGEPGDGAYAAMRTDYTYDDDGRLSRRRWARGVETDYAYTGAGELASVEYSDSTTDRFHTYDRAGRLATATDDAGTHNYAYTFSGRLELDDIDDSIESGILVGVDLDPSYDSAGRKTGFDATSAGNLDYDADFAYDPDVPRLASATLADATNNLAASYSYHADSDYVDAVTFSRGQTETVRTAYAYDRADRLSSVRTTAVSGGATLSSHGYLHDALGRRTRATRHDGTYWSYGYNARSEVTSAARHLSGGAQAPLAGRQSAYAYDDIGNRRHEDSGGNHLGGSLRRTTYGDGTKSGAANALNQYTLVANHGYFEVIGTDDTPGNVGVSAKYDAGAEDATAAGTHNQGRFFRRELSVDNDGESVYAEVTVGSTPEGGRFIGPDNEAPIYDDDGNLLSDARWDYAWNGENRLVRMETRPGAVAAGAPKKKLEFVYDHVGRRIERKVSDWSGTAWTVASHEKFLYDGWNVIARIDEFGNEQQSYLWGLDLSGMRGGAADGAGGVGGLLAVREVSEAKIYVPAFDGNGNVMAYADSSDASVDAEFEYDAFGKTVSAFGESAGKLEIRFSSKLADQETGLAYYGYRYYDPDLGRWQQKDRVGEIGGLNLYGFIENSPVIWIDVLGNEKLRPIRAVVYPGKHRDDPLERNPEPEDKGDKQIRESMENMKRAHPNYWVMMDVLGKDEANKKLRSIDNNCCIRELVFDGHGWYGYQRIGPKRGPGRGPNGNGLGIEVVARDRRSGAPTRVKPFGFEVFKGVTFCETCVIQFRGCAVGATERGVETKPERGTARDEFVRRVKLATGCRVYAFTGFCENHGEGFSRPKGTPKGTTPPEHMKEWDPKPDLDKVLREQEEAWK